jgi:hypothetical protein
MNIEELIQRASEYVELEAETTVLKAEFAEKFKLMGREDIVISVETTDENDPPLFLVCSPGLCSMGTKNLFHHKALI